MKLYALIFILFIPVTIWSDSLYGVIDYTGFTEIAFNNTLDISLFSFTNPRTKSEFPSFDRLDLVYNPNDLFNYKLSKIEDRLINNVLISPFSNLKLTNIYSYIYGDQDILMHHGVVFKRDGIYSFGVNYIKSFSGTLISGDKIIVLNKLELYNFTIENLFESKKNYITPIFTTQEDTIKSKSTLFIPFTSDLTFTYKNYLTFTEDETLRENFYNFSINIYSSNISINSSVRDKTESELTNELVFKVPLFGIETKSSIKVRYIDGYMYYGDLQLSNSFSNLNCEIGYNYQYELIHEHNFFVNINIIKSLFDISIKFNYPLDNPDEYWDLEAKITLN